MRKIFEITALITIIAVTTPTASATGIGTVGIQLIQDRMTDVRPILVAKKLSASKSRKRVAKRLRGGLAISPSAAKGDGYPTPGKAFQACGGAGNVFVMYDIGPDGQKSNHSYHCV
ncbi:MAG: hypothetical protein QM488_13420 [Rhizobiaceae bacterium]